jgi:MFS family permease
LAFQIPNNFLMQRLPISKYMGIILVVWGVSFGCTALATNFGVLAALRVILGFFEACTYPCMFLLISMFYRRHEQVLYFSYMFLANAFATAFGGLIAFGIGYMQGLNGLSAWQYSYIIWGVITCALGVLTFFFLPDQPKSRWFRLTPEEHVIVDQRAKDNGMAPDTKFNINHIYEGLKDPRFYCYCALSFLCNLQNGSITIFSSQIIQDIGFTVSKA